jgi:hypothetical protein
MDTACIGQGSLGVDLYQFGDFLYTLAGHVKKIAFL